jgi:hypothetical protein
MAVLELLWNCRKIAVQEKVQCDCYCTIPRETEVSQHEILQLILRIGFHGLGLLHKISTSSS